MTCDCTGMGARHDLPAPCKGLRFTQSEAASTHVMGCPGECWLLADSRRLKTPAPDVTQPRPGHPTWAPAPAPSMWCWGIGGAGPAPWLPDLKCRWPAAGIHPENNPVGERNACILRLRF